MKPVFPFFLSCSLIFILEASELKILKASIYDQKTGLLLNTNSRKDSLKGDTVFAHNKTFNRNGLITMNQHLKYLKSNLKIVESILSYPIIGRKEGIKNLDGWIYYTFKRENNKNVTKGREKYKDMMIGQGLVTNFIEFHCQKLLNGEKITAALMVPSRKTSYNFSFLKIKDTTIYNKPAALIKMQGVNLLVRSYQGPSYWYLSLSDKPYKILEYHGKLSDGWTKRRVRVVYGYN
ncbi:MAG: hypothetical protein ABIA63_06530 [bacterium]